MTTSTRSVVALLCCALAHNLSAGYDPAEGEVTASPTPKPDETPTPEVAPTPDGAAVPFGYGTCITVSNPQARANSATSLRITWGDTNDGEFGYEITVYDPTSRQQLYRTTTSANVTAVTAPVYDPMRKLDVEITTSSSGCDLIKFVTVGIPQAPTQLSVAPSTATSVKLSWVDKSKAETAFRVERRVNGGAWSSLTTVGKDVVTAKANLACGTNTYRVRSETASTSSWYTNEVTFTRSC